MTGSVSAAQLADLGRAVTTTQRRLVSVSWPATAEGDVRSLDTDLGNLVGAIANQDQHDFVAALTASMTAAGLVRADLGLPQA